MHEELLSIIALWRVDHALDQGRARVGALERAIAAAEVEVEAGEREGERLAEEDRAAVAEERRLSRHLEDYQGKRDRTRRLIDEGRAPDYLAATRQVEQCAAIVDQAETALLNLLEERDRIAALRSAAEAGLLRARRVLQEAKTRREQEFPGLEVERADLIEKRGPVQGALLPHHLGHYQDLRKRGREPVSTLHGGSCSACHLQAAPQVVIEVGTARRAHTCRGCGRYLMVPADEG